MIVGRSQLGGRRRSFVRSSLPSALPSALPFGLACVLACGSAPEGPSDALRDDARAIAALLADDLVLLAVQEADDAVADDLPVRGAERLRSGALPAARRQVERARGLTTRSPEGATLKDEALRALEARQRALEGYADVLERGLLEDLALATSLREQREAEAALDALLARLEELQTPTR